MLRLQHLSLRTERSYLGWLRRFYVFTRGKAPATLSADEVEQFVSHLAVEEKVAASTQNQAFSALLFFFRHALKRDLGNVGQTVRARYRRRLPVVLSRQEVRRVLALMPPAGGARSRGWNSARRSRPPWPECQSGCGTSAGGSWPARSPRWPESWAFLATRYAGLSRMPGPTSRRPGWKIPENARQIGCKRHT